MWTGLSYSLLPIRTRTLLHQSVSAGVRVDHSTERPPIAQNVLVDDNDDVVLTNVRLWMMPLSSFLERRNDLSPPALPKLIGKVLGPAPAL